MRDDIPNQREVVDHITAALAADEPEQMDYHIQQAIDLLEDE